MENVRIENAQEFDSFVRSHPKGHMFQTSAWGNVKKEWEWRGFISRDADGKIKGTCGVLLRQIPMTPFKMMYAPRGPVCDLADKETVRELLLAVKEYGIKNKAYTFKIDTDTLASDTEYINLLKELGFTFKEHRPDTRNTRVIDIMNELGEYGIVPVVADPVADADEGKQHYGIEFVDIGTVKDMDAVIIAVAHDEFLKLTKEDICGFFNPDNKVKVLADIKGLLNRKEYTEEGFSYWRL